jgi:hypothetical protein
MNMHEMDARDATLKFLNQVFSRYYTAKILKAYYSRQSSSGGNIFVALVQSDNGDLDPCELVLSWNDIQARYEMDFIQVQSTLLGYPDYDPEYEQE